jgi:Protein of unknown function (DUF1416)
VNQLVSPLPRATFWVAVLLLLAGSLATVGGASAASSPNYVLTGYAVNSLGHGLVGTQVDLQSRATGQIFTTSVQGSGGLFNFTTSSTSGALVPGYWSVWVPAQANVTYGGCAPACAVLPVDQTPLTQYFNATNLTSTLSSVSIPISILLYTSTIKGTVTQSGGNVGGASVQLLDPLYNGFSFYNTTTNLTGSTAGAFTMYAPPGSWVLRTTAPVGETAFNVTQVTVPTRNTLTVNPVIQNYLVYGRVLQPNGNPVPNGGNLTVWDLSNNLIYSSVTPAGGFYSFGSYNFSSPGTQRFDVILSTVGYSTAFYQLNVNGATAVNRNVVVQPLAPGQRGIYTTNLNFSTLNVATGKGSVSVNTSAALGNDTVFATLPNATVGQMWSQLGLDFQHAISLPSVSDLSAFYAWENASGPFFPAVQANLAVNGTGFIAPTGPQGLTSLGSTGCSTACGLGTGGSISLGWNTIYQLNGTLATNSSAYTISFGFAHAPSADTYNYTLTLPTGYALAAGTAAPTDTKLVPLGTDKTWTKFTLISGPSPTPQGSASFSIVKYANLTANVNVTSKNFAFSTSNVLNATHNNYTVVVGVNQNVTFSALNSTYPAGTNGTKFVWDFGTGPNVTVGQPTTNHTYTVASGSTPYAGSLKVTSSGGLVNSTKFFVWVGLGPVTPVIATNASSSANRTAGTTPYVFVNWGTSLALNATLSSAKISSSSAQSNPITVATFTITAKGYKVVQNYSASQGASVDTNYTFQFLGAGVYYNSTKIAGTAVALRGWQYNLSLTVWAGSGQSNTTALVVLVNDTEKPVSSFQVLNSAGKPVSGSGVIAGSNLTAKVLLNAANASDPHNGTITKYYWQISNSGNSSLYKASNTTTVKPYPTFWLPATPKAYTINLTVYDLNGNKGWANQSLSVSVNSTTTPIMQANNLTAPTTYNAGTSYTIWVNLTAGGGSSSTAYNVTVTFSLTSPTGTSHSSIAGSPGSVQFYNYTGGVVNSLVATGKVVSMAHGTTLRAEIHWTPSSSGNYVLYANVTASNGYIGSYASGLVSQPITVNPNPTTQLLEYVAIAVAVIVVILLIVLFYRRRTGRGSSGRSTGRSSSSDRGSKSKSSDDTDDDDDEDT